MAALTRPGSGGYATRRAGSFSGRDAAGSHPVALITRLASGGYGTRRAGSFSGRDAAGSHPVALITRLSSGGYGTRRAGSFAGRGIIVPPASSGGGLRKTVWRPHFLPRPISDPAKTYAYTGAGGLWLGGAATTRLAAVRIYAYEASGGLRISGRAATVLHPIEDEEFLILGL